MIYLNSKNQVILDEKGSREGTFEMNNFSGFISGLRKNTIDVNKLGYYIIGFLLDLFSEKSSNIEILFIHNKKVTSSNCEINFASLSKISNIELNL